METISLIISTVSARTLYSLEKLIEWKQTGLDDSITFDLSLYSLEKLIEWKPSFKDMEFFH